MTTHPDFMKAKQLAVLGLFPLLLSIGSLARAADRPVCDLIERAIAVNGDVSDWKGIKPNIVKGKDHLWFGQGMTPEKWHGNKDLSYQWRAAWSGQKLYFLIEVSDDKVVEAGQPSSYLCDCVEVYLDYANQGGQRVVVMDGRTNWFDKCESRELKGYELHFLPSAPPRVYLDHRDKYAVDKPQTEEFRRVWAGEIVTRRTTTGYLIELGFSVPNVALKPGLVMGGEIGVCDDDGESRKSIMMWTGTKKDFWLNMDDYGKLRLVGVKGN